MNIYVAYTGARWSEVIGLLPECVHGDQVAIDWKLYELNGRFYRGRPKDGSMRPADLPPFLAQLLAGHLADTGSLKILSNLGARVPNVFLGPGRGHSRLVNDEHTGRCPACGRAWPRRIDGTLIAHAGRDQSRCEGSGQAPAEDLAVASWLPVLRDVTPHGLRHGLQTWMDEDGIPEVLKTERMGHELPGMHGVYGHVSPAMRATLKAALQARWEDSLRERARLCPRSIVPTLDALLAAYRQAPDKTRSQLAPKIGHRGSGRRAARSRLSL